MKSHLKSHIGYWINRLRMHVHLAFERRLDHYGISVAQWSVLVTLYDQQATSISGLSRYIEVDKAAISRVVGHLVMMDLINQTVGEDRRSGHLQLTDRGVKLVPLLIKEAAQNERAIFGDLSSEEKQQLQFLLKKISNKIPGHCI